MLFLQFDCNWLLIICCSGFLLMNSDALGEYHYNDERYSIQND